MHWQTAVLVLLGLLNLVATARVVGSPSYSAAQRMLQTILIWLCPWSGQSCASAWPNWMQA